MYTSILCLCVFVYLCILPAKVTCIHVMVFSEVGMSLGQVSERFRGANTSKPAYAFTENVQAFVNHFGVENCGFLTLTFSDDVTSVYEASRRFNSFRTNFLSKVSRAYIGVYERHKSGRIHFHFVVAFLGNVFSEVRNGVVVGFNYDEVKDKRLPRRSRYRSANAYLRSLWAQFREAVPKYGFGDRFGSQILPVYNGRGIAKYLAKYLTKGIVQRQERDKGFRLVRSTSGKAAAAWKKVTGPFAWNGTSSKEWREALGSYIMEKANIARYRLQRAQERQSVYPERFKGDLELMAGMNQDNYAESMAKLHGCNWCWKFKDKIFDDFQRVKGDRLRQIYFYEMGERDYLTVFYSPETGEVFDV